MEIIRELDEMVQATTTPPTYHKMPRRTLADKGIGGPTGAHVIEEVHTPFNFAFLTTSTGTTAFQNIIGVTAAEYPDRIAASRKALELAGVKPGDRVLFTYPPLVNVFLKEALEQYGVQWEFLPASSRDALLLALCRGKPNAVVGESSFLLAALLDATKLGMAKALPQKITFLAAGTPLDMDFIEVAQQVCNGTVHDLYGCQEFGWLTLDGIPLRADISLLPAGGERDQFNLVVGGLSTGDCFPVLDSGHRCNPAGKIITYGRRRSPALESTIHASPASRAETVQRLCTGILRIKARIVRPASDLETGAARTRVSLAVHGAKEAAFFLEGPDNTGLLDSLLQAQLDYQSLQKTDPAWLKTR